MKKQYVVVRFHLVRIVDRLSPLPSPKILAAAPPQVWRGPRGLAPLGLSTGKLTSDFHLHLGGR